jgi:hypothetical protein
VRLVLFILLLGSALAQVSKNTGAICLAPVPKGNDFETGLGNPSGGGRSFNFSVQINNGKLMTFSHTESILVSHLELEAKHRVKVFRDGKPFASFSFKFSEYKRHPKKLCLFINELYETWQLWDDKDCPWCKCR